MKIRWLPILGMVIGCLPVSIAGQKQVSGAGGYRISGTAVNSVTGAPLGQVHIVAARDDGAAGQLDTSRSRQDPGRLLRNARATCGRFTGSAI